MYMPLFLFAVLIMLGVHIYNMNQINPKRWIPKGYWKEHPSVLPVYFFAVVLFILSLII